MAFTRMKYTPDKGLKDSTAFPAIPQNEEAAREQFQRLLDQIKEQVNALMAALEKNTDVCGANQIGSGVIGQLAYNGTAAKTIWTQLAALNQRIDDAISGNLSISEIIGENEIVSSMILNGAVSEAKLAEVSVSEVKIKNRAVTTNKLGVVSELRLKERVDVGADKYDKLSYDSTVLSLKVEGCEDVQLCPVIFGPDPAPPSGDNISYPAGTIYIQYVE
jgi:hypothetical protein